MNDQSPNKINENKEKVTCHTGDKKRKFPSPVFPSSSTSGICDGNVSPPSETINPINFNKCANNDHHDNNDVSKPKPKKKKTKHLNPQILDLRRTIQKCCATNDFNTAIQAYQTLHVEQEVTMEPQSFYNLLNLCEGSLGGERGIHIGTPKNSSNVVKTATAASMTPATSAEKSIGEKSRSKTFELAVKVIAGVDREEPKPSTVKYTPSQRKNYAFKIKDEMDKLEIPLNETAYTALMRILCQTMNNDLEQAEQLLSQAEQTQQCKPKLRMYSCLIDALCNEKNDNLSGALRVWSRMNQLERKNKHGTVQIAKIEPTEKEYCSIMKCAVRVGDVQVMERILSEIAEDVLIPSSDTKDTIISWFQSKHSIISASHTTAKTKSALNSVEKLPLFNAPSMGPLQYIIEAEDLKVGTCDENNVVNSSSILPRWEISVGDTIDTKNGMLQSGCLKGRLLKPVELNHQAWDNMIEMNEEIVVKGEVKAHGKISKFAGGGKGKKRLVPEDAVKKRVQQWDAFKSFLMETVGPPCNGTATTENKSNDRKKKFDVVIDGANVGYYKRNFVHAPKHVDYKQIDWVLDHFLNEGKSVLLFMHERHFGKQLMPKWAKAIVQKWDDSNLLYRTPHGSNDDWFWMHAALWCGRGTMVLSNDLMRDHHFQMLAHRSFLRWRERHQIYFDFGGWDGDKRKVLLTKPDVYSRRMQRVDGIGLCIPLPKRGDENRFLDGSHEADDSTPIEETYACINLNKTSEKNDGSEN